MQGTSACRHWELKGWRGGAPTVEEPGPGTTVGAGTPGERKPQRATHFQLCWNSQAPLLSVLVTRCPSHLICCASFLILIQPPSRPPEGVSRRPVSLPLLLMPPAPTFSLQTLGCGPHPVHKPLPEHSTPLWCSWLPLPGGPVCSCLCLLPPHPHSR